MALANFIDRAAVSASQVLANFDLAGFLERLDGHVVGIGFDAASAASLEGAATLDLSIRLLAQLYPRIALVSTGGTSPDEAKKLEDLARAINPDIEITGSPDGVSVAIVVGASPSPFECETFHLGSEGWTARLSRSRPLGSGNSGNPVGAGAAACFGAANAFRWLFRDQLARGDMDDEIDLSMLTFDSRYSGPEVDAGVDLGEVFLVGAGAIGNAFLWACANWAGLRGELHVIDHEAVDLTNLQRYVLATHQWLDRDKTDMAQAHLASTDITLVPHPATWQDFVADRGDWHFDRVAVALDSAGDRVAVQGSLPRWIANAWTQETDLGVSRHIFGNGACLACLYMPAGRTKDAHVLVAEELGMPDAEQEVKVLLQTGTPVDEAFVQRVATALEVPFEPLAPFVGRPVASFHQAAICGGLVMKLSGGKAKVRAVVPMSFQSALAGIMLAAEVLKDTIGASQAPTTSTRIDLLRPLAPFLHDPKSQDRSGRCICADPDFLEAYNAKYEVSNRSF
ncbi:MAG: E2 ligase fold family C protein [Sphingomonadales bacterium]|nr:E2 ligase fold family C protein [Sphingomonadales bacterium]MDE2172225.1 E2 ligase fold family C protein [Sphingomonadales bacterium]